MAIRTTSYEVFHKAFTWEEFINTHLDWNPDERFNIAHEAIEVHSRRDPKKVAIFYVSAEGKEEKYTYRELDRLTARFANVLRKIGVQKGDRVAIMLPRCPENYIAFLGVWRAGAVDVPLYTAFGPEAVVHRVRDSGTKVLITDWENREKVSRIEGGLVGLSIIVVAREQGIGLHQGDLSFWHEMTNARPEFNTAETKETDLAVLQYTSGTTGLPKGTMITHGGIIAVLPYPHFCLGLKDDDMFWGFADPGWSYGLLTVGTSILVKGDSLLIYGGRFEPRAWYEIMERYEVTNFTAAPSAYRAIAAAGEGLAKEHKLKARRLTSGGEHLNPEVYLWFQQHLGLTIADQYGTTEAGILLSNYTFMKEKLGSMGKPYPGFEVTIMDEEGNELPPGETGIVVAKKHRFFLSEGYWGQQEKWEQSFIKSVWYNTGDLAAKDEEGYFFFKGRHDDIIMSAGYRIGPAEVESAVMEHPSVAEVAAVGKPDPQKLEIVKAFIVLKPGFEPSEELAREIQNMVRDRFSKHAYPREIEFLPELPRTESGKVMRRELRKRA